MKRFFTLLLLLSTLSFTSCVDDSYDLGSLDNDNTGLGDSQTEITAPIGSIEIDLSDIIVDFSSRAATNYTLIDQTVEDVLLLSSGWLNDDFKDQLTANGSEIVISAECTPFPVGLPAMTLEISFGDIDLFDQAQTISADNTKITSTLLDSSDIDAISLTDELSYKLDFAEKSFTCDFEDYENITINISITRTGAITF